MMLLCHRKRYQLGFLLLLSMLYWPLRAFADPDVTISLKTRASIDEGEVTLGRIAKIQGSVPAQTEKLSKLVIGPAPLPGYSLRIYPSMVEQKLKNSGIMDLHQWVVVDRGPVTVDRRFGSLSPDQIRAAVIAFIGKNAPWPPEQIKIRPVAYRQTHHLPPGKVDLQIMPSKFTDWCGAETFTVHIRVDGRQVKKISVPVFIEAWSPVVLSARPLGRGQPIKAQDLIIENMDLSRAPANAIVNKEQVVGSITKRAIAANTIMRSDQITSPALIRKGDVVKVVAESAHINISTQAIAQESGRRGERIELINLNSKQKIYAQIVDNRTVKVQF